MYEQRIMELEDALVALCQGRQRILACPVRMRKIRKTESENWPTQA